MLPAPSYGRKPPSSVSHSRGSPVLWPFLLFPGPHGGEGQREGDKLVAWPLSYLFLAIFQELQTYMSSSTSQMGPLLTHSVAWGKSLLSDPQSPQESKKKLNQRPSLPLNLCLPKFSEKMSEKALPLGSFPVGGDGGREFGDFR